MYYKMLDHWKEFGPPAYIVIASAHGVTKKTHERGDLNDLARQFSGTGGVIY